ncbi:hypothetical protein [uncultured Thiocystis sp.]|jgi:hypothetical protein|uniref:hypothetical protein n=1 Tax=uncultured Thiocystis sp. TaxID=1202134 RepID=UPI0025E626F6|nr:hypothetical protein [uncultured Thiocystis sp.]
MTGDPVPDTHHIARLCGGATIDEEGAVTGAAFRLRANEGYLSVNWLEHLSQIDRPSEIAELRRILTGKGMKLGAMARLAVLQVGPLRGHVGAESPDRRDLNVLHEPFPEDDSHCGIYGFRHDDDLIADLIAEIVRETYSARAD